jgi:hypothetical protein
MTLTLPPAALPCAMLLSAVFLAWWLGSKKSKIIDAMVFLIAIMIVLWMLFAIHVI